MLFRKDSTIRERATVALANLQRNAYAMSMLRNRLESRINFILTENAGKAGEYQEMTGVLELVKNSELILNELSGKIDLELTILPTGTVDSVNVATSLAGPGQHEVTTCVASRARNWRFDRGPYAVETVVFPFVFTPEERARMDRMVTAAR